MNPDDALLDAKLRDGMALHQQGRLAEAERAYADILARAPAHFGALYLAGMVAVQLGRTQRGVDMLSRATAVNPGFAPAHNELGNGLFALRRLEDAVASYDRAIALKPDLSEAYNNRGAALRDLKRPAEALASCEKAIALKPDFAEAFANCGNALHDLNRSEEALARYDRAIALMPGDAMTHYNRGVALQELRRAEEALASYDQAIALDPRDAEFHNNRASVLRELHRAAEALASCDRAIALRPGFAAAHNNRGVALRGLRRLDEALASYDRAIALQADLAEAWSNRGAVLDKFKRHDEAARCYATALGIDPRHPFAKGHLLHQQMLCCDWTGISALIAAIDGEIAAGDMSAEPFGWQGVATSPRSLQSCAELWNRRWSPASPARPAYPWFGKNEKIRLGYVSGEFRAQATAFLLVGVLEQHDKDRFEVYALDNGWDDRSETRRRVNAAVHRVIDIAGVSDSEAAAAIRDHRIDILIDLNGYFGEARHALFARQAAPVQVNYLGFPGTLGASSIDYIIADEAVIPESDRRFYSEKIAYLPHCYQPNDRRKEIAARPIARAECGLPEHGFVFCCFNNAYKILPEMFELWLRLLRQVEGSVLWLLETNAAMAGNLRRAGEARKIEASRLIFAKPAPLAEHLARHRCADLFLDTLPYNAHTTASDALWAGLPLLTCRGETFAGRVAASLLSAIGLPELVTTSLADYERAAVALATEPGKLAAIKRTLVENRLTTPLFDTALYTRHLEAAYVAMYERRKAGLPPDHIVVEKAKRD
jgi:predicted O-linked N-acetylglucosamine transferase (SPINDLY family)